MLTDHEIYPQTGNFLNKPMAKIFANHQGDFFFFETTMFTLSFIYNWF